MEELKYKRTSWIMATCALLLLILAPAKAGFRTGNDLVRLMYEYEKSNVGTSGSDMYEAFMYMGYITGVFDATESKYSCPSGEHGVTVGQICEVVSKYLKANPEKWTEPAADLIIKALMKAFPKK